MPDPASAPAVSTPDFRLLFEAVPIPSLILQPDFRIVAVNQAYLLATRTVREDIVGRALFEVFPDNPNDLQADGVSKLSASLHRVLQKRAPDAMAVQKYDIPVREDTEGRFELRYWQPLNTPVLDAHGEVAWIMHQVEDVTAETLQREETEASEAYFRQIANAMPQIVWSALPNGYFDYFNQQWYDYTGMPAGSTRNDNWSQLFHPDDREHIWTQWRHSLATGEPFEIEYRLRHHSGEYRWALGRALPIRNQAGEIERWMGTSTDIAEQRHARESLQQENRSKDDFLAMLAHELRNPLAPISSAADLLQLLSQDEKIRRTSDIISRQVKHLTELVDDLLDVSRVTRGLVLLEQNAIDFRSVVDSAIEQAMPLIASRGHTLSCRLAQEDATVLGDATRLVQVVANLLNNSAKYTPPGGEIRVLMDVAQTELRLCVSDNGIGMEASLLPQVFDLFIQARRTPERSQGGLGLGLALVKSIMAMHGGSVAAISDGLGKGSTFTLVLPLARAPARTLGPRLVTSE